VGPRSSPLDVVVGQTLAYLRRALPPPPGRVLEVGPGRAGSSLAARLQALGYAVTAVDPDPLAVELARQAGVAAVQADFEDLTEAGWDVVLFTRSLHHLPDLDASFREFRRVLRPGGRIAFCGEPSRHGDRLAALPKRAALAVAPYWRRLLRAAPRAESRDHGAVEHGLEHVVDVHAFSPSELRGFAARAGFDSVRVTGEELVAGWFGWANRTLESTAEAGRLPRGWYLYAWRGYRALKLLDDTLLERALPPAVFYNLLVSATAPATPARITAPDRDRASVPA
jgi:SAM-dependent methyltransferase